jgi:glutathione S-transferase
MAEGLRELGLPFDKVDVDTDPALRERFGRRVPVLTDQHATVLCEGRWDAAVLRARLGLK